MYKIETSVGDIFFNLNGTLDEAKNSDIIFLDDGINKLRMLYILEEKEIEINLQHDKYFLSIGLSDGYYGLPEYKIISKDEWEYSDKLREENNKLKEKIQRLKEKIKYQPGNEGFMEARNHFNSLIDQ